MYTRIKYLRNLLNLSQQEFADKIGLAQTSLSEVERGINKIREAYIIAICSTFNVNKDWLLNRYW